MDKFFEILKKLRPGVQQGKITRERAKDILMQESGVSEQMASKAADNMIATNPEVSGGITTINREKKLPEPDNPSVEERTGGLLKEGKDYKIGEDGEYISLRDQETGIDPDLAKLGDKDSFEYEMALYRQRRKQKMEKIYKQFGAVSETDKNFVDEYIDMDSEGNFVFSSSNPKYDKASASIFIQESLQDIAGAEDIARNILYGRVAENIYADEGLEAYINYASKELKKEGLEFNEQLLKKIMNRRRLAGGGRVGFSEGSGKKGILSILMDKLNEIAPGSTNIGKTTKVSEKAKRKRAEEKMFKDFEDRNKLTDSPFDDLKKIVDDFKPIRVKKIEEKPPPGSRGGEDDIAAPFNVEDSRTIESFMEFVKKTDPEGFAKMQKLNDQINEAIEAANKRADAMEEAEALKKKGRKLNAGGGLNYLMGL